MINLNIDLKDGKYSIEMKYGNISVFNSNGNMIHYKDSNGYEFWKEYDSNGNMIHYKNSNGYEFWYHNGVEISKEEYDRIHNSCHGKVVEFDGKKYQLKEIKKV